MPPQRQKPEQLSLFDFSEETAEDPSGEIAELWLEYLERIGNDEQE